MTPQITESIATSPMLYRRPIPAQIKAGGHPLFYIWPQAARFHFIECWEAGMTMFDLADEFGISRKVVDRMTFELDLRHKREQRGVMTGRHVARILGRDQQTVRYWIVKGHIKHRKQHAGSRVGYVTLVTPRQLKRFLSDSLHFHRYDPTQITDRYWQWIALEARAEHGQ